LLRIAKLVTLVLFYQGSQRTAEFGLPEELHFEENVARSFMLYGNIRRISVHYEDKLPTTFVADLERLFTGIAIVIRYG
jgi:hypothetical protein